MIMRFETLTLKMYAFKFMIIDYITRSRAN